MVVHLGNFAYHSILGGNQTKGRMLQDRITRDFMEFCLFYHIHKDDILGVLLMKALCFMHSIGPV